MRNIAMRDYHESVTTGQTDTHTQTDGQTDAGQSDPYVPLCFAGDTKNIVLPFMQVSPNIHKRGRHKWDPASKGERCNF